MKRTIAGLAMVCAGSMALAGAAFAEPAGTPQKAIVVEAGDATRSDAMRSAKRLQVDIATTKSVYSVREPITFVAQTNRDAYLYLYTITDDNRVVQLFPNRHESANQVRANTRVTFPNKARIFGDSPGREKFMLIATAAKLDMKTQEFGDDYFEVDRKAMEGLQKSIVLEGPTTAAAPAPAAGRERVMKEFEVVIKAEESGFMGDELFAAPAAARPLVLVTTDKYRYRLNDKVTFGYAADTTGYLKIYQISPVKKRSLVTEGKVEPGKVYQWVGKAGAPAGSYALVAVFSKKQENEDFGSDLFMKNIEPSPGISKGLVPLDTPEIFTVHRFEIVD